ncbi:DUF6090 family protein [Seonamhaeicola maritimus]|uniref:Uncharacterized protein n=1 Tax=Seonamhaeicola maritimus TaxID=2591822 RepID=A0A5C7GH17_9FLAO|nr:DUF6090 family protein [Seonamhaeicola maritimus]TXG36878.1 hypothetical protein FUA22_09895 [Seonamhaeicola maritimus]
MIKFFRKIRQKLLAENRFSKYLLYAVGEIVLVVIGILIALQINTWNQEKANQKLEVKILKELKRNLKKDLIEITSDIGVMDENQIRLGEVIKELKNNVNPSDEFYNNVAALKRVPHFDPIKSAYEFLHSKGVDIISNDSLREIISNHYELNYPYYNKYENERLQFKIHQTNDYMLNHFIWFDNPERGGRDEYIITGEEFLKVRDNGSLERIVAAGIWENSLIRDRAKRVEEQIEGLIQLINKELE